MPAHGFRCPSLRSTQKEKSDRREDREQYPKSAPMIPLSLLHEAMRDAKVQVDDLVNPVDTARRMAPSVAHRR